MGCAREVNSPKSKLPRHCLRELGFSPCKGCYCRAWIFVADLYSMSAMAIWQQVSIPDLVPP
jgi:hypothetical protein